MTRRSALLDRRAVFSTAAAAALLAATGVSASGPQRGGRLRMALSGASRADTWQSGAGLFMQVARQGLIFDNLTEIAADGTLRGELAVDWSTDDAGKTWIFGLRQGVTFHDGTPFTAADVVASAAGFTGGTVRALGPYRAVFDLHQADARLPLRLASPEYFIPPAHAPDAGIGTGLYRVSQFTPGQRLLANRVAQHWKDGNAGWFEEVELASIPSEAVRGQALIEALVDAVDTRAAGELANMSEVALLPDAQAPRQAVSSRVARPAHLGTRHPLDDLRAAERWWFA